MHTALIRTLYLANNIARVLWWFFFFSRTIGRVTMSRPAEWTTWSSSRRYRRVPLWTISKRGLWRTPYLYPFVIQETPKEYDQRLKEAREYEKFSDGFEIKINTTLFLHLNHHHCLFYHIFGEEKNSLLFKPIQ